VGSICGSFGGIYTLNKIKSTQMEKYTDVTKTLLQIKWND
jgi:hypothetical protein